MKEQLSQFGGCELELEGLLLALTARMRLHFERVSERLELTPPQATALRRVGCGAPMRELADHMGCDASYVTGLADALEARGLIERLPDPKDRRVKQLVVTEEGSRVREALQAALLEEGPIATQLSQTEKQTLVALLSRLLEGYAAQGGCENA